MFCSSAQHGREKKRDIFVPEMTRESRSPIQSAQKKKVNPDRNIVILSALLSCARRRDRYGLFREMTGGLGMRVT